MRNTDVIAVKLEEALTFLYEQDAKLKPMLECITSIMVNKIKQEDIPVKDAFEMFTSIQELYTNNILTITKIKEIIDFKY